MPRKGKPMMSPEYQRAWRAKNPDRVAGYNAKQRVRSKTILAATPTKTAEELRAQHREWKRLYNQKNHARITARRKAYEQTHKDRYREVRRRWRQRNSDRVQAAYRARQARKYGISIIEYDRLLNEQHGACAICLRHQPLRKTKSGRLSVALFCVDHDHVTGRVRGLLCTDCNLILGNARDGVDVLQRALVYLERHQWPIAV